VEFSVFCFLFCFIFSIFFLPARYRRFSSFFVVHGGPALSVSSLAVFFFFFLLLFQTKRENKRNQEKTKEKKQSLLGGWNANECDKKRERQKKRYMIYSLSTLGVCSRGWICLLNLIKSGKRERKRKKEIKALTIFWLVFFLPLPRRELYFFLRDAVVDGSR